MEFTSSARFYKGLNDFSRRSPTSIVLQQKGSTLERERSRDGGIHLVIVINFAFRVKFIEQILLD